MVDAFVYFFFIGAGTASGVGVVGFGIYKLVQRQQSKAVKRTAVRKGVV